MDETKMGICCLLHHKTLNDDELKIYTWHLISVILTGQLINMNTYDTI